MSLCISFLIYSSRDSIKERLLGLVRKSTSSTLFSRWRSPSLFANRWRADASFSDRDAYFSQVSHFVHGSNSAWQLLDAKERGWGGKWMGGHPRDNNKDDILPSSPIQKQLSVTFFSFERHLNPLRYNLEHPRHYERALQKNISKCVVIALPESQCSPHHINNQRPIDPTLFQYSPHLST